MSNSRTEPIITISDLQTQFGRHIIHENLQLTVPRGQVMALVGGSGAGKTTLLRALLMLLRPTRGSIRLFGEEIIGATRAQRNRLSRRFGVLFQRGALFTSLSVRDNIALVLREHTRLSRAHIHKIAHLKIALAGLPARAADQFPSELSGGMIKRAALARALALDPELLFLDEPSAGLDPVSAHALDELIVQLKQSLGLTVVMVTHDLDSLWHVTDQVAFLAERRVIAVAPMTQLIRSTHPAIHAYFSGPRGRAAQYAGHNMLADSQPAYSH